MVIMGGPLMGFTLAYLNVPIVKISNCILAPSKSEFDEASEEQACIRCSQCADACPAGLLPQQLYWFSRGQEHEESAPASSVRLHRMRRLRLRLPKQHSAGAVLPPREG
ncbi:Nitrogen fixation protein rnfC [Hafnia alvei]|uniref:Nitrogen fixation protein rnfC n=1 Tax=Hafnia alvei TaxID=569 RepID=A0A377PJ15_HAFAL|nr:Nitrogen fixation protein rnfC [Hafnia alvei]